MKQMQRVLNIRRTQKDVVQKKLHIEQHNLNKIQEELVKEQRIYFEEREMLNAVRLEGNMHKAALYERSLENHKNRMMALLNIRHQAQSAVAHWQAELQKVEIKQKQAEKILEKQEQEWQQSLAKKEQQKFDELGLRRKAR